MTLAADSHPLLSFFRFADDTMSYMKLTHSSSLRDTEMQAKKFVEAIIDSYTEDSNALVVGLSGELGSGKTTFMKGVAKALGVTETVTSPTFVIMKTYNLQPTTYNPNFNMLIHIDVYRLEKEKELLALGWEELKKDPESIIFIEWPEKVKGILPKNIIKIKFIFIRFHNYKTT